MELIRKGLLYVANRMRVILALYVASLLVAAALFALFEEKSLWDGLWWAAVTALTIGYGDLSPASALGRITGIVFGHFWVFGVIPLIIANILTKILEDKSKFTHDEQEWVQASLKKLLDAQHIKCEELPPDY